MMIGIYGTPAASNAVYDSSAWESIISVKARVKCPAVIKKRAKKPVTAFCLKDNNKRIDHAGSGMFLKKDAIPAQAIRSTRDRPVV